jgi:hypothetical protein
MLCIIASSLFLPRAVYIGLLYDPIVEGNIISRADGSEDTMRLLLRGERWARVREDGVQVNEMDHDMYSRLPL